ncbi:MAG: hypothetical protein LBK62_05835 [Treponema sp.]|nr:hypothetical protein [Treponema sp.]
MGKEEKIADRGSFKTSILKGLIPELVPKLIDYALKRMVRTFGSMEQALAVFIYTNV